MTNTTDVIRILSADDHPLLRAGIGTLIATQPDMQLVGEASTGKEAVQLHRELYPDVTLMDLQMPDTNGLRIPRRGSLCLRRTRGMHLRSEH
jgi:DNA-binding NarL/FixJ family response regulator